MSELNRRHFLARMTALTATAAGGPQALRAAVAGSPAPKAFAPAPSRTEPPRAVELPHPARPAPQDPAEWTLAEAARLLRAGDGSAVELVEAYLARIERWDSAYQAFNTVLGDAALEAARAADRRRAIDGPEAGGPLAGVPLAIKDNYFTADVRTTANSLIFEDFEPDYDATSWARLREAGAILLGKTQMGPLATTAASTPQGERTTVNAWAPHHPDASPGGSSSGSATAVAARMAASSTGTQTGGSITNPAGAQGLTGLKPTMGRVSLHGILPLTYTRDHPGPIARDAVDAALMLQVMAGPDPADPRSLGLPPPPDYMAAVGPASERLARPERGGPLRVGVLPDFLEQPYPTDRAGATPSEGPADERDQATLAARRRLLDTLADLGADVVTLEFPAVWETLTTREFNNVRLPERSEIFLEYLREDVRQFGVSLSPWINGLLLPGAEYARGSRARLILLRAILDEIFARCDLVTQTAPFPFDMVGLPLVSFPIAFETASTGHPRPIDAMFGAQPYAEHHLLSLAAAYQRAAEWHLRRPADPDALRPADGEPGGTRPRYDLADVMERGE